MTNPITPQEAAALRIFHVPEQVIAAVNALIAKNLDGGRSFSIKVDDVIKEASKTMDAKRSEFFENKWLNFEQLYRDHGWDVTFHSPDYTESFPSYYEFKPMRVAQTCQSRTDAVTLNGIIQTLQANGWVSCIQQLKDIAGRLEKRGYK